MQKLMSKLRNPARMLRQPEEETDAKFIVVPSAVPCIDLTVSQSGPSYTVAPKQIERRKIEGFLNDEVELGQWKSLGVSVDPEEEAPAEKDGKFVYKVVPGTVSVGGKDAVHQLLKEKPQANKDTGVILFDDFMIPSLDKTYEEGKQYVEELTLGQGTFGSAVLIKDKTTRKTFVSKTVELSKLNPLEILTQMYLSHPGLITIYGLILRGIKSAQIYMEYAGYSFDKVVGDERLRSLLTGDIVFDIAKQGYSALSHLQKHRVMYLDCKPQNACLNWIRGRFQLKLCDFGACLRVGDKVTSNGWTPLYMAPEQCRFCLGPLLKWQWSQEEMGVTPKADVYSWACSLLYLCYWKHVLEEYLRRKLPMSPTRSHLNPVQVIAFVASNGGVMRCFVEDHWDPRLREVLLKSFCSNPSKRISAAEALEILSSPKPTVQTLPPKLDVMTETKEMKVENAGVSIIPRGTAKPAPPPVSSANSCLVLNTEKMSIGCKRTLSDRQSLDKAAGGSYQSANSDSMEISGRPPCKKSAEDQHSSGNLPNLPILG